MRGKYDSVHRNIIGDGYHESATRVYVTRLRRPAPFRVRAWRTGRRLCLGVGRVTASVRV